MQRGIRHLLILIVMSIIKGHGWKRADMHASLYPFTGSSFTITRNEEHK